MQHFPPVDAAKLPIQNGEPPPEQATPLVMQDRAEMRLSRTIGAFFSILSFTCQLAVGLLALFFMRLVAQSGETGLTMILSAVGVTLICSMLILEWTQARALAGYRSAREVTALKAQAFAGALVGLCLCVIHPVMGLPVFTAAGFAWVCQCALKRFGQDEPLWDALPNEAVSILAGRDRIGLLLNSKQPLTKVMALPVTRAAQLLCAISALAAGSYLVGHNILAMVALVPLVLVTGTAASPIIRLAANHFSNAPPLHHPAERVTRIAQTEDDTWPGLEISDLSVRSPNKKTLLSDISLRLKPGQIASLIGPSGAGKSLLLSSIADPFGLTHLEVSGRAHMGGKDLWLRSTKEQNPPVVFLPSQATLLPATGAENLACFQKGEAIERGKWFLERLVFDVDMVASICDAKDARTLPSMQRKALSMARAFVLGPPAYLFDKPEDDFPDKQVTAMIQRLDHEARMGRSVLMVTNNRALLERCDKLFVMHQGRIVDFGPAGEVRSRMDSGWSQFIGKRQPQTEETLVNWIRAQFYRHGDEGNRRKVATIASDLLALSCKDASSQNPGQIRFLFKHFEGHCLLRMQDDDPAISKNTLLQATTVAESEAPTEKLPLLAGLMRRSMKWDCDTEYESRRLTLQIETYDPRKLGEAGDGA